MKNNFIKNLLDSDSDILHQRDQLLNINIPGTEDNCWKEISITKLGKSVYHNTFESRKAPFGKEYYWITGHLTFDDEEGTDLKAIQEGNVSITPLHSDLTNYKSIITLKNTIKLRGKDEF